MKTHRFEIAHFFGSEADDDGNIYIDWPSVHRQAGIDHIQWIKDQDPSKCQLVLERRPNDNFIRVVTEIYSDELVTLYGLMWAK
jgi:hypothetical protein